MNEAVRLAERLREYADHPMRDGMVPLLVKTVHSAATTIEQQAQRIGAWSELLWDIYKAVYGDKDARGMADPLAVLPKVVAGIRKHRDEYALEINALEAERDAVAVADCPRLCADFCNEHQTQGRLAIVEQRAQVARNMVNEQALDAGLWFVAETASEGYLQQELRRLHAAVEGGAAIAARQR